MFSRRPLWFKNRKRIEKSFSPIARKKTLQRFIHGKVRPASVIHSDDWCGYDGLVDVGYNKYYRVHHGHDQFADGSRPINGIEFFWSFAKRRLKQFNGVSKKTFYLHLKETEFRFNHRNDNLYKILLAHLREVPL